VRFGNGLGVPQFTQQPVSVVVNAPAAATFTATVIGATSLQWQRTAPGGGAFSDISGATSSSYTTAATDDIHDSGRQYRLLASNPAGETFSNVVTLTVLRSVAPVTGTIPQYLTSDGGIAAAGMNYSGPTRTKWHNRLGFDWIRPNTMGNWRDSAQVAEGATPFASSAAVTTVGQVVSITATALLNRWISTGHNRGAYLAVTSGSLFPVSFHGRTDPTPALRPRLTVVTSTATFVLTAQCNAWWSISSFTAAGSAAEWRLSRDQSPGVLRFDLSTLTGTVTSATLAFTVKSFPDGGSTGQVIGLFELDPPSIIDPTGVQTPVAGLLTGYSTFNAFKSAGLSSVLLADDFESPGPFDAGFTPPATRTLNQGTGTTYARGTIASGGAPDSGTPSADNNKAVSSGTGLRGAPNVVYEELFGHYAWYMESTFGTTQEDAIKIPAMGVQFGIWNPVGYWQQTTGNGGSRGTGLKVDRGGSTNFEYQGHSIRLLTGTSPKAGDDDPYNGLFGLGVYPYNLDQVDDNPAGEAVPYVALKRETWYDIDIRVKQNTVTGAQDVLGNYATANADGIYQIWINGLLVYSKTTFRWRRHLEFGVQGLWIDVYHGGKTPALVDMHYRVDRAAIATAYIGPPLNAIPVWVTSITPGEMATYTGGGSVVTNNFRSVVSPLYDEFYSVKIVNDFSGAAANPWWGTLGAKMFKGAGHSASNDNSTMVLEYGQTTMTWKRVVDPSPWTYSGTGAPRDTSAEYTNQMNYTWGEYLVDGKPMSLHSYGMLCVQGPDAGGAANGTMLLPAILAGQVGSFKAQAAHALPLTSTTTAPVWARASTTAPTISGDPVGLAAYVPAQRRVYLTYGNDSGVVRWLDTVTQSWVTGSGTGFALAQHLYAAGEFYATMVAVPERDLLLVLGRSNTTGNLVIQWMAVGAAVNQPTLGGTAALSAALTLETPWTSATWCPDNGKLLIIGVAGDLGAVHEVAIPTLPASQTWQVTRVPLGAGQTLSNTMAGSVGNVFGKWGYDRRIKAVVFVPVVSLSNDQVYVYRPLNT
jgi:hypothetical protein